MSDEQQSDPNPYEATEVPEPVKAEAATDSEPSSGQAAYNAVTDVVTGPNVRLADNLIQAAVIFLAIPLGAGIALLFAPAESRIEYVVVGGIIGLLAGLFGSGGVIMVYRGWRHMRGKHD